VPTPAPAPTRSGWIEVITGSMFSGKSEELIRRVRRAQIARQKVQLFKPRVDARFSRGEIVSHSEMKMPSQVVDAAAEILEAVSPKTRVVAIDEGQFFDMSLVEVADTLASRGLRVIVAGLDQDYRGRPFEPMPQLMAVAEYVDKTLAVCMQCGAPANRSQRLVPTQDRVVVGGAGEYEARCRGCFTRDGTPPRSGGR
jgi:thymidine kinase